MKYKIKVIKSHLNPPPYYINNLYFDNTKKMEMDWYSCYDKDRASLFDLEIALYIIFKINKDFKSGQYITKIEVHK